MLATGLEAHPFVERGACEGGGLLTTRNSHLVSKERGQRDRSGGLPRSWPPPAFHLLGRRWKLHHNRVLPASASLCRPQQKSHLQKTQRGVTFPYSAWFSSSTRGDSALPWTCELQERRPGLGRGNTGFRRGIQGWQSLRQLYRLNRCQMLIVFCVVFN